MQDKSYQAGDKHPEEWRQDLNPTADSAQDEVIADAPTGDDIKELYDALPDFSKDELKQIVVLPAGTRLEQGATYVDLRTRDRSEFTAIGGMEVGERSWIVPKSEVDYQTWNRLIGITNPERTGEAEE